MIESYLPAGASEEEIDAAIAAAMAETGATSAQADGRGDEGRAGEADGQDRGRQSAERKSEVQTFMTPPKDSRSYQPFVPREHEDAGVHAGGPCCSGLVMCVVLGAANAYLGLQGRPDDRRHLSRGGHRHGRAARLQGLDPRREHRANRRLDRRIGGGGRDLHHPRVRHLVKAWPIVRFARGLLEIHRADAGGQRAGRAVRLADPPRDGGRSRTCRSPNPWRRREIHKAGQAGAQGGEVSLLQHRRSARVVFLRGAFGCSRRTRTSSSTSGSWARSVAAARAARLDAGRWPPAASPRSPAPTVSPAYIGVGYIIGPELAALNFSGSVIAWGLLIPLLIYLPRPADCRRSCRPDADGRELARPGQRRLALHRAPHRGGQHDGGHLLHAVPMRKNLIAGLAKAVRRTEAAERPPRRPSAAPSAT